MSELRDFVEFEEGNIPLIISVPHGGILECTSIPERTKGVLGIDKGTIEFSKNLIEQISLKFKAETTKLKVPFYIISKVRRSITFTTLKSRNGYLTISICIVAL